MHKNISHLPFLRGGQRSVDEMLLPLQSPHWDAVFFCLSIYMKPQLAEFYSSWVTQQTETLLFPSSQLGEIHTWEKPQLKSRIQVRILERKMLLAPYTVLKGCCPRALNVSVLSPHDQTQESERLSEVLWILIFTAEKKPEELWANVKVKDFLYCVYCM